MLEAAATIANSLLYIAINLLTAAALSWILGRVRPFSYVRGLKRWAVCFVFAPVVLAWMYGWSLRIFPGQGVLFYLLAVVAFFLPFSLLECWALIGLVTGRNKVPYVSPVDGSRHLVWFKLFFVGVAAYLIVQISLNNLFVPVFANDPLEYFSVARAIFLRQQLSGVYPVLNDEVAGGFYGPWTHPPGFVLMLAWAFLVQSSAEFAGIAKLLNAWNLFAFVFLVFTWGGGFIRFRGILAASLVVLTPLILIETFESHVDVVRIAAWTATFCLALTYFKGRSLSSAVVLGIFAGLSMFIHSIGLVFWGVFLGLSVVLSGGSPLKRVASGALAFSFALLVVAPDYLQNIANFGRVIGDSAPLWENKELNLDAFLNEERGISATRDRIWNGLLAPFVKPEIYGHSNQLFAVLFAAYVIVLMWVSRFNGWTIYRKVSRPTFLNVLCWSMIGFFGMVAISVLLGSNLIIKNARYLVTMIGCAAIANVILADVLFRYLRPAFSVGSFRILRLRTIQLKADLKRGLCNFSKLYVRRAVWLPIAIPAAYLVVNTINEQSRYRSSLFPGGELQPTFADMDRVLRCSRLPSFQLISAINKKMESESASEEMRVLSFRPADTAYYGRFKMLSYLDPRLVPAFLAKSNGEVLSRLLDLGVSHIYVPPYKMGEIENTAFQAFLSDDRFVQLDRLAGGFAFYRLAGKPRLLTDDRPAPISVEMARPLLINMEDLAPFNASSSGAYSFVSTGCSEQSNIFLEDQGRVVRVRGHVVMALGKFIEIDPSNRYRLSFDLRVTSPSQSALTLAGLATFDADGRLQLTPPGAHRYGVFADTAIQASAEWHTYVGEFSGVGNENFNQFRKDTKYVTPVFFLNNQVSESTTEIRDLKFEVMYDDH